MVERAMCIKRDDLNIFWDNMILEEQKKRDKMLKMFSGDYYINWLQSFTQMHPSFADDDWTYFPEKISAEDKVNVEDLPIFYEALKTYAEENYYLENNIDYGGYFLVKIGECFYKIGLVVGQGAYNFCTKVDNAEGIKYIDFEDARKNKKQPIVALYKAKLEALKNEIIELNNLGIGTKYIAKVVSQTIEELNKNK